MRPEGPRIDSVEHLMRRVMIIGGAGAGKSTLAQRLGDLTGLPVVHIDPMYWKPEWIERDIEEARQMVRIAAGEESWIFDGNNSSTFNDRLARADTVIFLDISTIRRLFRVLRRTIRGYGQVRPDTQSGCPERFDYAFLRWVVTYSRNGRHRALSLLRSAPEHIEVYHLHSPSEVKRYLARLQNQEQKS